MPTSIGGTNVAIDWPNMWLSGSRFRNRIGWNGRMYFRYFAISRSIGMMFARMFRWVIVTPFGSAVAPDVKMISASDTGVTVGRPAGADRSIAVGAGRQPPRFVRTSPVTSRRPLHFLADEHPLALHDGADAPDEIRRRAVVHGDDDDTGGRHAPERDNPFRPVLGPDDELVFRAESRAPSAPRRTVVPHSPTSR